MATNIRLSAACTPIDAAEIAHNVFSENDGARDNAMAGTKNAMSRITELTNGRIVRPSP